MKAIVVLALFVFKCHGFNKPPSYIKVCSKSDPNFNKCAVQNGRDAIPYILKGDPTYTVPNLKQFKLNYVSLEAGENLKLYATNVTVLGLDGTEFQEFNWNFEQKMIYLRLYMPTIIIQGTYNMKGRILIMTLDGSGFMNNTHYENDIKINVFYSLKTRNNKEYIYLDKVITDITILKGVKLHFANLLNNTDISKRMNEFLNENWKTLVLDMMPSLNKIFSDVVKSIINPISEKIPFDNIVIP